MADRLAEIVLVRHGETEGQSSVRLNGSTDVRLARVGRQQMERVRDALVGTAFDQALASPLRRSRDALNLVLGSRGPTPEIVPAFREIDFGAWERMTWAEVAERHPVDYAEWQRGLASFRFPEGDTKSEFRRRVAHEATARFHITQHRTLGVLHKGVIKAILAELLGVDFTEIVRLPVELGSIHRLERTATGWRYTDRNVVDHLRELWIRD